MKAKDTSMLRDLEETAEKAAEEMLKIADEHWQCASRIESGDARLDYQNAHIVWYHAAHHYSVAAYLFDLAKKFDLARAYDKRAREGMDHCSRAFEHMRNTPFEPKRELRSGMLIV